MSAYYVLHISNYYKKCKCNMPKSFSDDTVGILRKKKIGNNSKYTLRLSWREMGKDVSAYKPSMISEILVEL